jgi:tellurite resistance protein
MVDRSNPTLIERIARKLGEPSSFAEAPSSILTLAGAKYGSTSLDDDPTQPTGFDPRAAALFEAIVESAYLVANADGEFDAREQETFKAVVLSACGGKVGENQLSALLADLADVLAEDGIDKRVQMVARNVTRPDHAREVLRVAGLLAQVSDGVSDVERGVLDKLARELSLEPGAVEETLLDVERALAE